MDPTQPLPKIEWKSLRSIPQWISFATHRLEQVGAQRLVFVETTLRKLHKWSLPCLVLLSPFISAMVSALLDYDEDMARLNLMMTPVIVLGTGIAMMMWMTRRPSFDRERNAYWCQRAAGRTDDALPISKIRALQLIESELDGQLELNLVLDDGSRRNLLARRTQGPPADVRCCSGQSFCNCSNMLRHDPDIVSAPGWPA
jgi:hypothetical protein